MNMQFKQKQNGSILLISLMLLIVVTLLTFAASRSALLQEKMTATTLDNILALEASEQALVEAEKNILANFSDEEGQKGFALNGGTTGFYDGDCSSEITGCFINTLYDKTVYPDGLFDDNFWKNSTTVDTGLKCGASCTGTIKGQYVVINQGEVEITLSGTQSVMSVGNEYPVVGKSTDVTVRKYQVISRAKGLTSNSERVLVSYFAAEML